MARVTEFPSKGSFGTLFIFDLTERVGFGMKNNKGDVQLVQLSLNRLIGKFDLRDFRKPQQGGPVGAVFAPLKPLNVDGFFGKETANAIESYLKVPSSPTSPDRVIDPVHPLVNGLNGDPINGALLATSKILRRIMFCLNRDHLRTHGTLLPEGLFPQPLRSEIG
jgi:hypothetical protein